MSPGRTKEADEVFCRRCGEAIKRRAEICPACGVRNERYAPEVPSTGDAGHSDGVANSSTGDAKLDRNTAGALSYALGFVTGLPFYLLDDDAFVRFHAAQSIVVFGGLAVATVVSDSIYATYHFGGAYLMNELVSFAMLVFWVFLIATAYQGQTRRVPVAADIADALVARTNGRTRNRSGSGGRTARSETAGTDPVAALRERYARGEIGDAEFERRLDRLLESERTAESRQRGPKDTERAR